MDVAEMALYSGDELSEVAARFGNHVARSREVREFLDLMETYEPGWGALTLCEWLAAEVDAGRLVVKDGG